MAGLDFRLMQPSNVDMLGSYQRGFTGAQQQQENSMVLREKQSAQREKEALNQAWQQAGGDENRFFAIAEQISPQSAAMVREARNAQQDRMKANRPTITDGHAITYGEGNMPTATPVPGFQRPAKPPTMRDFNEGGNVVTKQFNEADGQWMPVSTAPRWNPKEAGSQGAQRGQIIFDSAGNAFNVNPYTNAVSPVNFGGKQITGAQYSPELSGQVAGAKAFGTKTGGETGAAKSLLDDLSSQLPNLHKMVGELSVLGQKATYTLAGQGSNIARRQLGMDVGEGALARKEYISKVDNEILPLLRQTFGAAFTVKEGEALRATLGDVDASPAEKDRVLKSFIAAKTSQIEGLERRTGDRPGAVGGGYDDLPSGAVYVAPDGSTRRKK